MHFLQRNAYDLATFAGQIGAGISSALDRFKPPQREAIEVTPSPPPPPPPPDGGRVRRAARAIEDRGPYAAPAPPTHTHPEGRPGSSRDTIVRNKDVPKNKDLPRNKDLPKPKNQRIVPEEFYIGDKPIEGDVPPPRIKHTAKIVKEKTKHKKSAGVSKQVAVPDHQEKLTKHGKKKIITAADEKDKPTPHVPHAKDIDYVKGTKRKDAPPPPKTSILRKKPLESGPVQKKQRRVSAHQV